MLKWCENPQKDDQFYAISGGLLKVFFNINSLENLNLWPKSANSIKNRFTPIQIQLGMFKNQTLLVPNCKPKHDKKRILVAVFVI